MRGRIHHRVGLAIALTIVGANGLAASAQATSDFDLPSQPLADSLRAVATQSNVNVLFDPPLVADRQAPALKGGYTPQQAFAALLRGTGIKPDFMNERTLVLAAASSADEGTGFWRRVRLAQADSAPRTSAGLEEVVVTATRREESVRDVPISVAVFSEKQMDVQGMRSIDDLARFAAGLTFSRNTGLGNDLHNSISIRGVSSNGAGAATTGVYIDDTPIIPFSTLFSSPSPQY